MAQVCSPINFALLISTAAAFLIACNSSIRFALDFRQQVFLECYLNSAVLRLSTGISRSRSFHTPAKAYLPIVIPIVKASDTPPNMNQKSDISRSRLLRLMPINSVNSDTPQKISSIVFILITSQLLFGLNLTSSFKGILAHLSQGHRQKSLLSGSVSQADRNINSIRSCSL